MEGSLLAYKVIKSLNRSIKEDVNVKSIETDKWAEHYRSLWYDDKENSVVNHRETYPGVDDITWEELTIALKGLKIEKHPDQMESTVNY